MIRIKPIYGFNWNVLKRRRRKPWAEIWNTRSQILTCLTAAHCSIDQYLYTVNASSVLCFFLHKCAESIVRRIETCLFFLFFPDSKASSQSFRHLSAAIYWLLPFCDWCLYTPCKYQSATILGTPYWYWVAPSSAPFHLGREIRTKGEKCLKMTHWTRELLKDT